MSKRIKEYINYISEHIGVLHRLEQSVFWRARTAQERAWLLMALTLVLLVFAYALLVKPALHARAQLEKDLPILRQQTAQLQSLAKEAAMQSQQVASTVLPMTKESIETGLARNGLISSIGAIGPTASSVAVTGNFAKVQLSAIPFANLLNWLEEIQKTARISVAEANVLALPVAGNVNASLTLRQTQPEIR